MNNKKINLIFVGTSDFGVSALISLQKDKDFNILAVITQPDKKSGRGQKLNYSPIKKTALKLGISVWQPGKIADSYEKIKNLNPDIIIVIAYAQLIPQKILDIPKYGCLNVHGSLLPLYRGASCIQAPILNGDKKTGVSFMLMDEKLDHGPIIKSLEYNIKKTDTAEDVFNALATLSAKELNIVIKNYIAGKIKTTPQDSTKANYVGTISKNDGLLNWKQNAKYNERLIRAMHPWPGTWTRWNNKILKIIKARAIDIKNKNIPGYVFEYDKKPAIECSEGSLLVEEIQLEGKKAIPAEEFLKGHKQILGKTL